MMGMSHVDFIKIDAEGPGLDVLAGAVCLLVPDLTFEATKTCSNYGRPALHLHPASVPNCLGFSCAPWTRNFCTHWLRIRGLLTSSMCRQRQSSILYAAGAILLPFFSATPSGCLFFAGPLA